MFHMKLKKNLSCKRKVDMEFQVETSTKVGVLHAEGEVKWDRMFKKVGWWGLFSQFWEEVKKKCLSNKFGLSNELIKLKLSP